MKNHGDWAPLPGSLVVTCRARVVPAGLPRRLSHTQIAAYMRKLNPFEEYTTGATPKVVHVLRRVPVDDVRRGMAPEVVAEYAARPTPFPPVVFNCQGISDGRHRMAAARLRGDTTILAYVPVRCR